MPRQGESVHPRQLNVHQNHIRYTPFERTQGLFGIFRSPYLESLLVEKKLRQLQVVNAIVDQQNRFVGHVTPVLFHRPSQRTIEAMEKNLALRALAWLGRHELAILLAIGSLAAGVWLFAALADEVMEGGTQKVDRTLLLAL